MRTPPRRGLVGWLLLLVLALGTGAAAAQGADLGELAARLRAGGHVIVFRHGATNRDQADTDPLHPSNVASQRRLSDAGRDVARQVGQAFRKLGIPIGRTFTSQFDRAVETGRPIGQGEVTTTVDLTEGGLVVSPIENDRRAAALKAMAAAPPEPGRNTLIVTHKPNILDAFGRDWFEVREGEASIFEPDGTGFARLVARVQAADWLKAAAK